VKQECFSNEGLAWTIHPRYKQWISFHQMNLVDSELSMPWAEGAPFDLILCRNVMIYFAPKVNRRLIGQLHGSLADEGWLVVGSSEHGMEGYQAFRTVNAPGARLYQKTAPETPDIEVEKPEKAKEPPLPGLVLKPVPSDAGQGDVNGLRQLLDLGNWQVAAHYGEALVTRDRLNPEIHFYQALIFENLGIEDRAERSLRQAIYLDRNFALAHYHLGLTLKRGGQLQASARSFGNVLKVLAATPDEAIVTAGAGVTATGLRELAKMHMEAQSAT
jgi:chemotaxis protein methyltransferase CheR